MILWFCVRSTWDLRSPAPQQERPSPETDFRPCSHVLISPPSFCLQKALDRAAERDGLWRGLSRASACPCRDQVDSWRQELESAPAAVTAQGTGHNGSCPQGHPQAAPPLFGLGDRWVQMAEEGWTGWGQGRWPRAFSGRARAEALRAGLGASPGLGAEVLGAPRAGSCPERLWACAGCLRLLGTLGCGRDRAWGRSALASLVPWRGTAQPRAGHQGGSGRVVPMPSPARVCAPFSLPTPVPTGFPGTAWGSHVCSAHRPCPRFLHLP